MTQIYFYRGFAALLRRYPTSFLYEVFGRSVAWINVPLQALGRSLSSIIGRAGHLHFGFPRVILAQGVFGLNRLESRLSFGKSWMTEHWGTVIVFT